MGGRFVTRGGDRLPMAVTGPQTLLPIQPELVYLMRERCIARIPGKAIAQESVMLQVVELQPSPGGDPKLPPAVSPADR